MSVHSPSERQSVHVGKYTLPQSGKPLRGTRVASRLPLNQLKPRLLTFQYHLCPVVARFAACSRPTNHFSAPSGFPHNTQRDTMTAK